MRRHRAQRIAEMLEPSLDREGTARRPKVDYILADPLSGRTRGRRKLGIELPSVVEP
jgi:hypothetical protein